MIWILIQSANFPPTFRRLIFYWLLEGGDVTEGAEEEDHFVLLVPDWSDLHKEPNRQPCGRVNREASWGTKISHNQGHQLWRAGVCRNLLLLTVLLVHQNLEGVHLIVLEGLSNLFAHLLVRQLAVHEAAGAKM